MLYPVTWIIVFILLEELTVQILSLLLLWKYLIITIRWCSMDLRYPYTRVARSKTSFLYRLVFGANTVQRKLNCQKLSFPYEEKKSCSTLQTGGGHWTGIFYVKFRFEFPWPEVGHPAVTAIISTRYNTRGPIRGGGDFFTPPPRKKYYINNFIAIYK